MLDFPWDCSNFTNVDWVPGKLYELKHNSCRLFKKKDSTMEGIIINSGTVVMFVEIPEPGRIKLLCGAGVYWWRGRCFSAFKGPL